MLPEIVTGGQDGCVKVWDPRQNTTPVVNIESVNGARDCWSVAFGNSFNKSERCVCAGYSNGDIKIFDLRAMEMRWESNVRNGICCMETSNKYRQLDKLVTTTTLGGLNVFDFSDENKIPCISKKDVDELPSTAPNQSNNIVDRTQKRTGNTSTVWCIRHLPQNPNIFATCGGIFGTCGNLRLWLRLVQVTILKYTLYTYKLLE